VSPDKVKEGYGGKGWKGFVEKECLKLDEKE